MEELKKQIAAIYDIVKGLADQNQINNRMNSDGTTNKWTKYGHGE